MTTPSQKPVSQPRSWDITTPIARWAGQRLGKNCEALLLKEWNPTPRLSNRVKSLFTLQMLRRCLVTLASLVTLIVLFYTEENWRGRHAWETYRRSVEAKGESLRWEDAVPSPVPEAQNFAATPLLSLSLQYRRTTNGTLWLTRDGTYTNDQPQIVPTLSRVMTTSTTGPSLQAWCQSKFTDLPGWQFYLRDTNGEVKLLGSTNNPLKYPDHQADFFKEVIPLERFPRHAESKSPVEDILYALTKYDAEFYELYRAAEQRPQGRFALHYDEEPVWGILLPHLYKVKMLSQALTLHAVTLLADHRPDEAMRDLRILMRLDDAIRAEPFYVSLIIREIDLNMTIQVIWEGVMRQAWSASQLEQIQEWLAQRDYLADFRRTVRVQRNLAATDLEYLKKNRGVCATLWEHVEDRDGKVPDSVIFWQANARWMPSGWFEQNKVFACRMDDELRQSFSSAKEDVFDPVVAEKWMKRLEKPWLNTKPNEFMGAQLGMGTMRLFYWIAYAQSAVHLARVGLFLERYRSEAGQYPESLKQMADRFHQVLPVDVIDGQPLRYRRISPTRCTLYSIGWNKLDEGGVSKRKDGHFYFDVGDWVWTQPVDDLVKEGR